MLHCADIHLDAPFTSLGTDMQKPAIRRQELKLAFKRIINAAKEGCTDLLLISGDLYEHDYVSKSTINFVCDEFEKIPDIRVLIIPGNHDPFTIGPFYNNFNWPRNVNILTPENPVFRSAENGICVFGGVPPRPGVDPSYINILMLHGTLDLNIGRNVFNPLLSSVLDAYGMDYVALGHFHNTLSGVGGKGVIYNPGSPEPLGFDEEGAHGVFMASIEKYSSDVKKLDVEFIKISQRSYRNLVINVDRCRTDEQAAEIASPALSAAQSGSDLYNIIFKGVCAAGFRINTGLVADSLKDKAFFIKIKDETIPDYDFENIKKEPGLRGLFTRKMLEKITAAEDEDERRIAEDALYFGMAAIDQGIYAYRKAGNKGLRKAGYTGT